MRKCIDTQSRSIRDRRPHTLANGRRCSTADGYLHPVMSRPNLTVKTKAYVVSIDFDGKRAVGISYEEGKNRTSIKARREVILSAGAYNSPQLLMLSGVGDPDEWCIRCRESART